VLLAIVGFVVVTLGAGAVRRARARPPARPPEPEPEPHEVVLDRP